MQTCIDSFALEQCPHCELLFPATGLSTHIQTHNPSSSPNNIDDSSSSSAPSGPVSPEAFDFVDLTEEFNQLVEHELYMKKIYGIDEEKHCVGFKKKFKGKMKKLGKHIVNFLYRNRVRFIGLGLTAVGVVLAEGLVIFFGMSMILHGGSDKNYYDFKKKRDADIIQLLPISDVEEENKIPDELKCVICLETFKVGDKFTALPCLHLFHFECIENYLKTKMECPVCKLAITQECFSDENFK